MTDHQMNLRISEEVGSYYHRLPLRTSPNIVYGPEKGNALRIDWSTVVDPKDLSYILGNPPFVGKQHQNADQKADMETVFEGAQGTGLMHMAWVRHVCGRLKSDYRYSNSLVYNNFPWPEPTEAQRRAIEAAAQEVLDARTKFPGSTLADLYDPITMPPELARAHADLDRAVDKAYGRTAFASEMERVAFLFERYEALNRPLLPPTRSGRKRRESGRSKPSSTRG